MKSATKHIVISTILCALTLVVFLAFYNRLPASIPVHFDSAGVANSFWPRNVVVFGVPVACVLLNLISGFTVSQKGECKAVYVLYHGCCCIRSNGHHDLFGDEVNCPNKNFDGGTVIFFECHFEFFLNKGKECYVTNQELIQKLRCEKGCKQP